MSESKPADRAAYYKYLARVNYECAKAADKEVGFWPGYEVAAPPPVMVLCAHSIELSLKAYLLDKGVSEREVRRLGHNLSRCWQRCIDCGVDQRGVDADVLEIISDLTTSQRLRYGEQSTTGKVPVFGPLQNLTEACLTLSGAPNVSDILDH